MPAEMDAGFASRSATRSAPGHRTDVVVVMPAYREPRGVGLVIEELRKTVGTGIVVVYRPDGDATEALVRARGVPIIRQEGRGKGDAVRLGLEFVRQNFAQTHYIGLIDADGTYPSAAVEPMREILEHNPSVGMVIAHRDNVANNGFSSHAFAFGNHLLAWLHRVLNKVSVRDPLSGLRLVRAELLKDWHPRSRGFDIECELNDYIHNVKRAEIGEVNITYRPRTGEKKLGLRHGAVILTRMVRLALDRPRRKPVANPDDLPSPAASPR